MVREVAQLIGERQKGFQQRRRVVGKAERKHIHVRSPLRDWVRAPDDLDLHRKVVQACFALGDGDAGEAALAALKEAWSKTPQAEGTGLVEVVIDQLRVAGARVMASQTLRPAHQDLWYEITWRVYGADGKVDFSVQLETSAYGREVGTPFLMGLTRGTQHRSVGPGFHARPPYLVAREIAVGHIQRQLES